MFAAKWVLLYSSMWTLHTLLVKRAVSHSDDTFDTVFMMWIVEMTKLLISFVLFCCSSSNSSEKGIQAKIKRLFSQRALAVQFAVPAAIYCVYNVLMFVNLQWLSAPSYRVLINLRVPLSGLLFQRIFHKKLSSRQWIALCLLMLGCTVERLGDASRESMQFGLLALLSMFTQAAASSSASVYFQWLLQKDHESDSRWPSEQAGLWEKNIFLYAWGSLLNFAYLLVFSTDQLSLAGLAHNLQPQFWAIIVCGSVAGISTSLLLQHLDVLAKEYANFLEMILVSLFSWILFATPINAALVLGIVLVSMSLGLYHHKPPQDGTSEAYSSLDTQDPDALEDEFLVNTAMLMADTRQQQYSPTAGEIEDA